MIQEIHEAYWMPYVISYRISRKGNVTKRVVLRCGQQLYNRTRCEHLMIEDPTPGIRYTGIHVKVWPDNPWSAR